MTWRHHILAAFSALCLAASAAPALSEVLVKSELAPDVTLEVTELRRLTDKDAVQMKFAVVNNGTSPTSARKLGFASGYRLDGIVLIDFVSKKSYTIGGASRCLCSTFEDGGEVAPGKRREFWAWFGLPAAGVQAVSIQLADQPPLTDVPLR